MLTKIAAEPVAVHLADTAIIYDIATLLNAVYQVTIEPTRESKLPKRLARKLYPLLSKNQSMTSDLSDDYLNMLFEILREMHLVGLVTPPIKSMKQYYAIGPSFTNWAQQDLQWQTLALLQHWQTSYRWDDRTLMPLVWGLDMSKQNARITLLAYLHQCQPGQWYSVQDLLYLTWQEHPLGLQPVIPQYMHKIIERKARLSYDGWLEQNEGLYTSILTFSLHDLGIVDIGFHTPEEDLSDYQDVLFRITAMGQDILQNIEHVEKAQTTSHQPVREQTPATFIVQPNYEIIQLDFDLPALYTLLPFTQVISINRASRLQLTQQALHRGIRMGYTIERIIHLLQAGSQQTLPQNVIYTLQEWGKQYKQAVIAQIIMLELPSAEIAERLIQHPPLQKLEARLIAPHILVIQSDANLQYLSTLLEKEGIEAHFQGTFTGITGSQMNTLYP